jgi:hypothetical protein
MQRQFFLHLHDEMRTVEPLSRIMYTLQLKPHHMTEQGMHLVWSTSLMSPPCDSSPAPWLLPPASCSCTWTSTVQAATGAEGAGGE